MNALPKYSGKKIDYGDSYHTSLSKAGPAPNGWRYLNIGEKTPNGAIVLTNDGWERLTSYSACIGEVITECHWLRAVPCLIRIHWAEPEVAAKPPEGICAPPDGYVYLGDVNDIKHPENFSRNNCDFAYFEGRPSIRFGDKSWIITNGWFGRTTERGFLVAAKPNTPLYDLNAPKTSTPKTPMTHETKTLKYELVCRQNGLVAAKITEQSHRNHKFGVSGEDFGKLASSGSPENGMDGSRNRFFVRGIAGGMDSQLMLFTAAQFAEFEKEVAAYNAHFSKPVIRRVEPCSPPKSPESIVAELQKEIAALKAKVAEQAESLAEIKKIAS